MSESSARILYLTGFWPHDRGSGSQLRSLHIARALKSVGQVEVAGMDGDHDDPAAEARTAAEFNIAASFHSVPLPWNWLDTIKAQCNPRLPFPHGSAAPPEAQRWLDEKVGGYDLTWVFKVKTANLFGRWRWPKAVLDIDDIPSGYERTVAGNARGLQKLRALSQQAIWRRREKLLSERFEVMAVCSEADKAYLQSTSSVHVIPNGFEIPAPALARSPAHPPRIGFIGTCDYPPNAQGIRWFARDCWPLVKARLPNCRLRVAGKDSERIAGLDGADIDRLGWIADPGPEFATWSLMIVPIQIGGGTRLKMIEAFSRKCPVVSTALGAFGVDATEGSDLLVADAPCCFADACVKLIQNPAQAGALAANAWNTFLRRWTWERITPAVQAAAGDSLRRSQAEHCLVAGSHSVSIG